MSDLQARSKDMLPIKNPTLHIKTQVGLRQKDKKDELKNFEKTKAGDATLISDS